MANTIDSKKHKHLTAEDRKVIEECLEKKMTFKAIAKLLGKDPTTISYEVKHHRQEHKNSYTSAKEPCSELLKSPFVCNGCSKRHSSACHFVHFLYRHASAHNEYRTTLSEAREGTPLNKSDFYDADKIITDGLKNGQHIYHIMANSDGIHCSKSTVYRHFHRGYYSATLTDLPRAVKFKPRKSKPHDYVPKGVKVNRSYDDFCLYLEQEKPDRHVELDTLIGRIGGKVILTIHFTSCNFMTGLLLDDKTTLQASEKFAALKDSIRALGLSVKDTFAVLLADNGGEFANVSAFENDRENTQEIRLFFCDPMSPAQKPQIEKNHTLFRDIVPKGSSFDDFTQDTVNLIFSHVNSVSRELYKGKTPFDLFSFMYSEQLANALGVHRIAPDMVIQSPRLLKGIADLKKGL